MQTRHKMPRKRTSRATTVKPTPPTHPALASTSKAAERPSVNTLLSELRRTNIQSRPGGSHTPGESDRTSYPLRATRAAPARRSLSPRSQMADRRRARAPPGPPPPPSWSRRSTTAGPGGGGIEASVHAPRHAIHRAPHVGNEETVHGGMIQGISPPLQGLRLPERLSLQRLALESMARQWAWHAQEELLWIGTLPSILRERLVWTLADHGVVLDREAMRALAVGEFDNEGQDIDDDDALESWQVQADTPDAVRRLTIGPSLGSARAYRWLGEVLAPPPRAQGHVHGHEDTGPPSSGKAAIPTESLSSARIPSMTLREVQVPLTHLSLAGCPDPSWTRLLQLAAFLPHLTHLDLAEWPAPESSLTVVDKTGRDTSGMAIQHSALSARAQSTLTLRRLGKALSGLRWLGLEGCAGWMGVWTTGMDDDLDADADADADTPAQTAASSTAWDDGNESQGAAPSTTSAADLRGYRGAGVLDFARSFPCLQTLRMSPHCSAAVAHLLSSEEVWAATVARHTHDPHRPFPIHGPFELLRVPEQELPSTEYEGPRWVRTEPVYTGPPAVRTSGTAVAPSNTASQSHSISRLQTTAYTLQHATRLSLWRQISSHLDLYLDLKLLETQLRYARRCTSRTARTLRCRLHEERSGGPHVPFDIQRAGIDDAPVWLQHVFARWQRFKRNGQDSVSAPSNIGRASAAVAAAATAAGWARSRFADPVGPGTGA